MNTSASLNTCDSESSAPFARIVLLIALGTAILSVSRPCGAQTPPPVVDNSAGLPPVADQGSQHSSHAWALAYYCKTYQEGRVRGWDVRVPEHQFSPSFLYNQIAPFDEGTSFAELLPRLADQGCATLADFPYIEANHTTWPPYTAFRDAINYRIQNYTWLGYGLTPNVIANMKTMLAGGELCVIDVPVFKPDANTKGLFEWLNPTNEFYTMPADEDVYWGANQALTVVGYDDTALAGNGAFKVVNSWGTGWGNQGFAWLSYEFILAFASDIYTMQSRSNYQPTSFARFKLFHPFWGWNYDDVTVTIGVGNEANPLWSKIILTHLEQDTLTVDMAVDLTDAAAYLPPAFTNRWWIKVDDHSTEDVGLLSIFQIEDNGSNYDAEVVMPLTGPFFTGSFYAYLPAGEAASTNYYVNDDSLAGDEYCTAIGDDAHDGLTPATPKRSVQAIIDTYALQPGNVVYVDAGTYDLTNDIRITQLDHGTNGNPVRFMGVIASNGEPATIINRGTNGGNAFLITDGADYIQLENLWLQGGSHGIYFDGSWNDGMYGLSLKRVRISNTSSDACFLYDAEGVSLENCLLHDFAGYGLNVSYSDVTLNQSTIAAPPGRYCAGLFSSDGYYANGAYIVMNSSILTATGPGGACVAFNYDAGPPVASYCDFFASGGATLGFTPASSNLQLDPFFANPSAGDFHLKSTAGRWDPAANGSTGTFVDDVVDSPCIDAGDPSSPVGNEPIYNGARVNAGAYGGTAYASKSPANRRYLFIEQPLAGEICHSDCLIAWRESGGAWLPGETLSGEYSSDAGQSWQAIPGAGNLPYDSLSFAWNTLGLPEGTNYLVRLTSNQDSGTVVTNVGLFVMAHQPRNYYVNDAFTTNDVYCTAAGDDANDGLSPATPKASIQALLDAVDLEPGDTVLIDTGVYVLTNTITIGSADSGAINSPVRLIGSANAAGTRIDGHALSWAAIYLSSCSFVSLENLWIQGAGYGVYFGSATGCAVKDCRLSSNDDGIYLMRGSGCAVQNSLLDANTLGGIVAYESQALALLSDTLAGNGGSAVSLADYGNYGSAATLRNNIISAVGTGNACVSSHYVSVEGLDYNLFYPTAGAAVGSYDDVGRPTLGDWQAATGQDAHSRSADPLFVDPAAGDYHVQSTAGSWHGGTFSADGADSPCIDAGDPTVPVGAEPAPNGARINLGAYGGTAQASKTPSGRVLTLVAPNGGEIWRGTNTITWLATGQGWGSGETLSLEYSGDGGATWNPIVGASALGYAAGAFGWNVQALPSGARYRVRATCNEDPATTDASDANFTVHNTGLSFYVNDAFTTNDVYCTAAGDDANDGLSPATPKASIQALLDAVDLEPGDTVFIDTGVYVLTNTITIGSADSGATNSLVRLVGSTNAAGTRIGCYDRSSTAIYLASCSFVSLENLWIQGAGNGVTIGATGCAVKGCRLSGNVVGISLGYSSGCTVQNSLLDANTSGGITVYESYDTTLLNDTLVGNGGAAVSLADYGNFGTTATLRNNIILAAGAGTTCVSSYEVGLEGSDYNLFYPTAGATVGSYNNVGRPTLGDWQAATGQDAHSRSADPLFVDPAAGDYHVQSTAGSWHGGTFSADGADSPCIDAGDPTVPVGAELAPNGARINLGAYGGTAQASKTPSGRVLTLVAPNGGEIWRRTNTITWLATGQGWGSGETLRLEYSGDGGATWNPIVGASALGYAAGAFGWNVQALPSGARYRVRATCNEHPATTDASDANFTVHNTGLIFYVNDAFTTNDVYCTAAGDDANDGLSPATPKASIQALLDAVDLEPGDTVFIDTGVYVLTNTITIGSADSGATDSLVRLIGSTNAAGTRIDGHALSWAALYLSSCSFVSLENLWIQGAGYGVYFGSATGCAVKGCRLSSNDNGIYLMTSSGCAVQNSLLDANTLGGIVADESQALTLLNDTLAGNGGSAVSLADYGNYGSAATLRNNIISAVGAGNACVSSHYVSVEGLDYNLFYPTAGAAVGSYDDVGRPTLGDWQAATGQDAHSRSADPLFVDPAAGDYHVQSTAGSWHGGTFSADGADSPCIDAGEPTAPVGAEPAPNGARINLGAYGGTAQASKSTAILSLDVPAGGEFWRLTGTVRWTVSPRSWPTGDTISLFYSPDDGTTWYPVAGASGLPGTAQQFQWDLGSVPASSHYRVRVVHDQNAADAGFEPIAVHRCGQLAIH